MLILKARDLYFKKGMKSSFKYTNYIVNESGLKSKECLTEWSACMNRLDLWMPVDQHSDSISIFFLPFCLNFKIDKKFQNINKKLFKTYIVSYFVI